MWTSRKGGQIMRAEDELLEVIRKAADPVLAAETPLEIIKYFLFF